MEHNSARSHNRADESEDLHELHNKREHLYGRQHLLNLTGTGSHTAGEFRKDATEAVQQHGAGEDDSGEDNKGEENLRALEVSQLREAMQRTCKEQDAHQGELQQMQIGPVNSEPGNFESGP
ncbi:unnamed protein product [Lampetra fluviatilis]